MSQRALSVLTVLTLGFSWAPTAFSQGFGAIVGTVSDPSGAAVATAKVTATEADTGVSREAITSTAGEYVLPALRPTSYNLTVDAQGFKRYSQPNILLSADQSVTVNITLTVGQVNQTVTIEATVAQADTYTSTIKEVVDSRRIVDLPLNGRNAAALITLVPGAVSSPSGGADQGVTKTFPGAVEVTTNGSRQDMVAYNLDGVDNVDRYTNVNAPFPFPDALQEFSVQTANYTAEYGGNAGGVVDIITKSGSNAFHGDVFGFLRNGDLNARNYFAKIADPLKRGQEGGTIGGPVVKNKTFFFVGFQGTSDRDVVNGLNKFVPTPAEEQGDFSALLNAGDPNNPLSRSVVIKDPTTHAPFPNNQIPVSRFDPAAVAVTKFLPTAGGTGISFYSSPLSQNFYDVLGRADQVVSDKDHLNARYDYQLFTNAPVYNPSDILSYADGSDIVAQNAMIQETHIFSPTLLNELSVGFNREASIRGPANGVPSVRTFGVNIPYQPPANDVQSISVNGFFSFGDNPFARFTRNNFLYNDDLHWQHGSHNVSIGASFERRRIDLDNGFQSPGVFSFNGSFTGLGLSDFMLGNVYQIIQAKGQFENARVWGMGFYIQDDYKVTPRLTLNLGLRWEPYMPWDEIRGRVEGFSMPNYAAGVRSQVYTNAPPGLLYRGDTGFPMNGTGNNFKDFAPRVGFAWDAMGDGKTSVRGGAGMFYDSYTIGILNNNMVDVTPFAPNITLTPPPGPFSNPYAGLPQYASVLPGVFPPPKNVAFPLPVSAQTFNLGSGPFQVPLVYNWNIAVEHEFGGDWLGRIAYVGSHSSHLQLETDLNPATYVPGSNLSVDKRRIFQNYSDIFLNDESGNANLNSMQLTLQKRFPRGKSLLANYTYEKSIDNVPPGGGSGASVAGGGSNAPLPWYVPGGSQLDYGPSEFDREHVFVLSYVWDIPKPPGSNAFVTALLGNWEVTGIVSAETGFPFTIYAGKDISGTGLNADRGVYMGGNVLGNTACHSAPCVSWLNPQAFALPAKGTVGNVGKGAIFGPGLFNWDMGLFKNIPITERWSAQLRGEFFNALNHPNFTNSGNNYPNNSVNSAGFGTITAAYDPRIIQLALKVFF